MLPSANPDALDPIKTEIEDFLRAHPGAVLLEGGAELLDLQSAEWQVSAQHGKLLFEAWNGARSIVRRVEDIAYRDHGRLGLFMWKPGGRATVVTELRERASASAPAGDARAALRRDLTAYLKQYFPEWRLERVSNRTDRENSFSAWYTRGIARRGRSAWAWMGLSPSESSAAADAALAYGLNWLDDLRENNDGPVFCGLKLFLPREAIPINALRAAYLDPQTAGIEMFVWPNSGPPVPISPGEFANAETHLPPRREAKAWIERHRGLLRGLFGESLHRLDAVPDAAGSALSFRVFGLEIARMEGQIAPKILWGIEGNRRLFREEERQAFQDFLELVLASRRVASPDSAAEIYHLQPERWLESLLVRDLSKLDPALRLDPVYPQVPAFSGTDRGVVDIVGVTQEGRLAVIELKLHEDIALPLQGLDYWLRVKWLNDRGQFHEYGYFPAIPISPAPPLLYLVAPAFRFHPANERILRYFHPSIEVFEVGLNQQWREGVKVLFRRRVHSRGDSPPGSRK